jgi:YfiH family protein
MAVTRFFENQSRVVAIFTGREQGDMRPRKKGESIRNPNINALLRDFRISEKNLIIPRLENINRVSIATKDTKPDLFSDALVTDLVGKYLAITAADCYPIYLFDPFERKIGLAHGGYGPLVGGILLSTVNAMESIGAKAENVIIQVGPGICQPCYAWKRVDLWKLKAYNNSRYVLEVLDNYEKVRISLKLMIRDQLIGAGIRIENIFFSDECTCCNRRKFFSSRDGIDNRPDGILGKPERQLAVIGMSG